LTVNVVSRPGAHIRILRRLEIDQLRGRLVDERLRRAESDRVLLATLVKPGTVAEEDSEVGRSAEYRRSPMKVSQISRAISMVQVVL